MKFFEKNESGIDRFARTLIGLALAAIVALGYVSSPLNYIAGALALILLFTAATGSCLIYAVLGISTNSLK